MPIRRSALVILPALFFSWSGLALAAKLDKDDQRWLVEVRPIILADEEKTYRDL